MDVFWFLVDVGTLIVIVDWTYLRVFKKEDK